MNKKSIGIVAVLAMAFAVTLLSINHSSQVTKAYEFSLRGSSLKQQDLRGEMHYFEFSDAQSIKYNGRELIYSQARSEGGAYGIVGGYKVSEPHKIDGTLFVTVEPVPPAHQEEARRLLKGKIPGSPTFW